MYNSIKSNQTICTFTIIILLTTSIANMFPFNVPIYNKDASIDKTGELKQDPPSRYTLWTILLVYHDKRKVCYITNGTGIIRH